jgi:hypothetical protein
VSVQLRDAVGKLETQKQFSAFLERHLEHTVSWSGKREVNVKGYVGSIEIHTLIRQFLQCAPLTSMPETLQGRLEWYDLFGRMQEICRKSDKIWKKTFVQYIAFEGPTQDSMDYIRQSENFKDQLLTFKKMTLIFLWPGTVEAVDNYSESIPFIVSRDMLVEVVHQLEGKNSDKQV